MPKLQKEEIKWIPPTDWDNPEWTKEMYRIHEKDFQEIYREFKEIIPNPKIQTRSLWLEKKGAIRIYSEGEGYKYSTAEDKYNLFSNKWSRFNDWLSFREKREMSSDEIRGKIVKLKSEMKPIDFSLPKDILEGAERDVQVEEGKTFNVLF